MNRFIKWLFCVLMISNGLYGFGPKALMGVRSQGLSAPRELAGWQQVIYRPDYDENYFAFAVAPEYSHTFRRDDIATYLFGCKSLIFSGSQVANRGADDILADYFGLPSDFKSTVQFAPQIVNFVMDLDWYIGFDSWVPGLYAKIHVPIVHTKWDLKLDECVVDAGTTFTSYPAGYLAATPIEFSALTTGDTAPTNVKTALQGKATFGDMREPLKYGKVFGRQNDTRVAELSASLGYNFFLDDRYHFGLAVRAAAPTGTVRESEFLFEPIAGNGHHWELGGAVTGHFGIWQSSEEDQRLIMYLDANFSHLFESKQKRSFDLKNNGNGSRYMLLQKIASPSSGLHIGTAPNNVVAPNQYQGRLVPAINKTTLDAHISVDVQADVAIKLSYQRSNWEVDLGYNLWARSEEKIGERDCMENCYAVKGDAQLYGFTNPGETAVALNATQSLATIHGGQAVQAGAFSTLDPGNFNEDFEYININADNIAFASDTLGVSLNQLTAVDAARLGITQLSVRTSDPVILVTNSDINECSALLPKAISHKLFVYASYTPDVYDGLVPYAGGGGFVEFAHPDCNNFAPAQWGIWLKVGITK